MRPPKQLTLCRFVAVDETVSYESHPQDPNKTLLKQEAMVTVQGVPLNSYVEDMLTSKISVNAGKGRQAIEWVISKIDAEVKELANSAVKSTDELLMQTKKSLDEITNSARNSNGAVRRCKALQRSWLMHSVISYISRHLPLQQPGSSNQA
ncbi:unnamed protein product [Timema podura]|uniref:PRELI/MSF1 domain-containing protein n=1 Tax=Timema podura TaxID=61482 RepID=A0ABN7NBG4_TIMPD|nr:unnamed protein product [Timema podura]